MKGTVIERKGGIQIPSTHWLIPQIVAQAGHELL